MIYGYINDIFDIFDEEIVLYIMYIIVLFLCLCLLCLCRWFSRRIVFSLGIDFIFIEDVNRFYIFW